MQEIEHARAERIEVLLEGVKSLDAKIRRLAVRALGRLERIENRQAIVPLLRATEPAVRKEAVTAMGQIRAEYDWRSLLRQEADGGIRGVIYETIGRVPPSAGESEALLVEGLSDRDPEARIGAARGMEALFRLNRERMRPAAETLRALRRALRENESATLRELALLTLVGANEADPETCAIAMKDPNPQVRRLAVIGSKQWVEDPDPMVRYEALKVAGNCARAAGAVEDRSAHVALLAVDQLGAWKCDAGLLARLTGSGDWRVRSRALVSLATVDADAARGRLAKFAADPIWQVRAYAAQAAKRIGDESTLARLAGDANPNVVIAALHAPEEARRALSSRHYGLVLEAARFLKGNSDPATAPLLLRALRRLTLEKRATSRDPRMEILDRLAESGDMRAAGPLRGLLSDLDPAIAGRAAAILSTLTGAKVEARTIRYIHRPFPPAAFLRSLAGATARIMIRGRGPFLIELFPEEAPATAATFAELADRGYYNGLTFHRIVPNFVIQGGSPGANEYDGIGPFMPDEVGTRSHARGTLGISTRGRDTGDAQIFVNLVDNFRLDHQYTVFARVIAGMDVVDRTQEGDVIESVRIRRRGK
ncbi:MAG: peptidylprolyl isomerase [Blastocatellia bacterium]